MQLEELFDYKNKLMEDLMTNEEIVRLLDNECVLKEDPSELIYEQVFPYEYIPDTEERGRTFICFDVDIQSVPNKTFLSPDIYIWVFTHKKLLRLPDGSGVRTDKICHEIAKTINGSRFYGLGELNLQSVKRFYPIDDYLGRIMMFRAKDFNRLSPSAEQIPANRKRG